jgi:DNA modification methylase
MSDAFEVRIGHVMDVLRQMPDESVNTCVTSPPYLGLRNYGIPDQIWGGDPAHEHVWGEPISINATNHTDKRRWNHTRNGRGEEQPEEKQVAWLRTDVDQGSFCECGAWRGSLGLEPTPHLFVEHIVEVFREIRRVLRKDGTAWVNIGDSYNAHPGKTTDKVGLKQETNGGSNTMGSRHFGELKPKDIVGVPWRVGFALQADGWWLRQDIIWHKPNPMPESVTDRCTKAHEYIFLLSKSERYHYDADAIKEPLSEGTHARFGKNGLRSQGPKGQASPNGMIRDCPSGNRNKRSVWTFPTQATPEAHFATYPIALAETCILAGCPAGGLVLDPFSGAGTTGLAAIKHGRRYLGIELNPEYAKITSERTGKHAPLFA